MEVFWVGVKGVILDFGGNIRKVFCLGRSVLCYLLNFGSNSRALVIIYIILGFRRV